MSQPARNPLPTLHRGGILSAPHPGAHISALDPTLVAAWSAGLASGDDAGAYWRRAAQALLAERAEARALLGDVRWLVAETTYLVAGVDDAIHAQAVHLADRIAGFLDPPPPTPAELDAALRAEVERARRT